MLMQGQLAPDFELQDTTGKIHRLSDYRGQKVIVLAFLRGFMWPYCRAQLARLRDGYAEFTSRNAEILAIGPDSLQKFESYWKDNHIPFPGLPDPEKQVSKVYKQEINLFKLGRMPLNTILDRKGYIRFIHYGYSMSDIPDNEKLLGVIDELNASSE
jgi:peroxiredoxin Q/BCP